MVILIGLLTLFLVVDCQILIFLILIQLPKKEAGAGLAFGGSASDALFGAGSGNVLTKITKYTAGIFFGLAIFLAVLYRMAHGSDTTRFQQQLSAPPASTMPGTPVVPPAPAPGGSTLPSLIPTNAPAGVNPSSATPAEEAAPHAPATNVVLPPVPLVLPPSNAPAK